jgi:hypothetical protein
VKLVHLVSFVIKKFVMMYGHMNVKFVQAVVKMYSVLKYYQIWITNCHKIVVTFTVYSSLLASCCLVPRTSIAMWSEFDPVLHIIFSVRNEKYERASDVEILTLICKVTTCTHVITLNSSFRRFIKLANDKDINFSTCVLRIQLR